MKSFLFLITLQLSFISTFLPSNIAIANTQEANLPESDPLVYLTDKQVEQIIDATKKQPINVTVETPPQPQKLYENPFITTAFGTLLGILVTLVGNIIGGRRNKILNSIELIEQWDSESMRKCRFDAWKELDSFNDKSDNEKLTELNNNLNLLRIKDFFDRLTVIKNKNFLHNSLSKKLFINDYKSWHDNYFKHKPEWTNEWNKWLN